MQETTRMIAGLMLLLATGCREDQGSPAEADLFLHITCREREPGCDIGVHSPGGPPGYSSTYTDVAQDGLLFHHLEVTSQAQAPQPVCSLAQAVDGKHVLIQVETTVPIQLRGKECDDKKVISQDGDAVQLPIQLEPGSYRFEVTGWDNEGQ